MNEKLSKKHIKRLDEMLKRMDACEARSQKIYGDRVKGSIRSSYCRDIESLRAALQWIEAKA